MSGVYDPHQLRFDQLTPLHPHACRFDEVVRHGGPRSAPPVPHARLIMQRVNDPMVSGRLLPVPDLPVIAPPAPVAELPPKVQRLKRMAMGANQLWAFVKGGVQLITPVSMALNGAKHPGWTVVFIVSLASLYVKWDITDAQREDGKEARQQARVQPVMNLALDRCG